jgi:hypothetical protein
MSRLRNVDFSEHPPPPRRFLRRFAGALTLDATVYEEVEHAPDALLQAMAVVGIAALARGIGGAGEGAFLAGLLSGLASWVLGTAVIWVIGVGMLRLTSDFAELLRTLGFAMAPCVLYAGAIFPIGELEPYFAFTVWGLGLVAWVIAVRQALDVSTLWTAVICLIAALPSLVLVAAISTLLEFGVPGY